MAMKSFGFCWGKFYNILHWIELSVISKTIYVIFVHSVNNRKHDPPKVIKIALKLMFIFKMQWKMCFIVLEIC